MYPLIAWFFFLWSLLPARVESASAYTGIPTGPACFRLPRGVRQQAFEQQLAQRLGSGWRMVVPGTSLAWHQSAAYQPPTGFIAALDGQVALLADSAVARAPCARLQIVRVPHPQRLVKV